MSVRFFIVLVLVLVAFLALFLALVATETALSVWQRLSQAPLGVRFAYVLVLGSVSAIAVFLAWRWLRPRGDRKSSRELRAPESTESLQEDVAEMAGQGINVDSALSELGEQRRRKSAGEIHVALFGEVSAGKSSLVNALLPGADADSDPRAGTTRDIRHYRWTSAGGDTVIIADLPGFNLEEDPEILDESRRAHLVVFLCDGDLPDSQVRQLRQLQSLDKPLILALNKKDRYSDEERGDILSRLASVSGLPARDIVVTTTGGKEEIIRLLEDGSEIAETRERRSDVSELRHAIQRHIDEDLDLMESLQDAAVLLLAAEKLESARLKHRETEAEALVSKYSKRAVLGAMAAVAPGTDLLIQGALATRLIQELCSLYGVAVKDVQIESFLKLAGGRLKKMSALTLAIAGNAMKAFPGLGTLSGGILHAVAYGLIFDSLGRAAAATLASRGEFRPYPAVQAFEELMHENLETGAQRFAELALRQQGKGDSA